MALIPPVNTGPFAHLLGDQLPPEGTYYATLIDTADEPNVTRKKFEKDELETCTLVTFLFGFRDNQNQPHRVSSGPMRLSGHVKSGLYKMILGVTGQPPAVGQDCNSLKGRQCLLTVQHTRRRDGSGSFAGISSVSPLPGGRGAPPGPAVNVFNPPPPDPVTPVPAAPAPAYGWPQQLSPPPPAQPPAGYYGAAPPAQFHGSVPVVAPAQPPVAAPLPVPGAPPRPPQGPPSVPPESDAIPF